MDNIQVSSVLKSELSDFDSSCAAAAAFACLEGFLGVS